MTVAAIVSARTALVEGATSFHVARILLGLAEAGFLPDAPSLRGDAAVLSARPDRPHERTGNPISVQEAEFVGACKLP
jgi:hypothetical protein